MRALVLRSDQGSWAEILHLGRLRKPGESGSLSVADSRAGGRLTRLSDWSFSDLSEIIGSEGVACVDDWPSRTDFTSSTAWRRRRSPEATRGLTTSDSITVPSRMASRPSDHTGGELAMRAEAEGALRENAGSAPIFPVQIRAAAQLSLHGQRNRKLAQRLLAVMSTSARPGSA